MTQIPSPKADRRTSTVFQGGRAKAYRPLPAASPPARARATASTRTTVATSSSRTSCSSRPGWAPRDLPERELLQGLIKLAAANVHAVRGNAAGVRKNLRGARARLAEAGSAGSKFGLDAAQLVAAVERRLAAGEIEPSIDPPIPIERQG